MSVDYGDPRLPDRFWVKVYPCPITGCWLHAGGGRDGYPELMINYVRRGVHVWIALLDREIPPGYHVDHLCRVTCCVNPAHLDVVTCQINTLRGIGPSAINAARTSCSATPSHPFNAENTYVTPDGRRQCRACNRARVAAYDARKRLAAA